MSVIAAMWSQSKPCRNPSAAMPRSRTTRLRSTPRRLSQVLAIVTLARRLRLPHCRGVSVADEIRSKGKRMTVQRRLVLDALQRARHHTTAEEIARQVRLRHPQIDPSTVYRNLAALAALAGLVAGILVLTAAAPGLADRHDAETLEAWLGSEARLAGDLARDGFRARDPNVLDALARRVATGAGVRVTFIDPTGVVRGESDEERNTVDNHCARAEG